MVQCGTQQLIRRNADAFNRAGLHHRAGIALKAIVAVLSGSAMGMAELTYGLIALKVVLAVGELPDAHYIRVVRRRERRAGWHAEPDTVRLIANTRRSWKLHTDHPATGAQARMHLAPNICWTHGVDLHQDHQPRTSRPLRL